MAIASQETKTQSAAIKALSAWDNIVIKPTDRGGAIVVWPVDRCISQASRQLNIEPYTKLPQDFTKDCTNHIFCSLHDLHNRQPIMHSDLQYLTPTNTNPGQFCLLPQIHKANPDQLDGRCTQ